MKKRYVIPIEILLELREYFFGKRDEIAQKANMHYNSVRSVLKGESDNVDILQAMFDILSEDSQDDFAIDLAKKVGKLIKSKKKEFQTA